MRSPIYFKSLWEFNSPGEKKKSESNTEAKDEMINFVGKDWWGQGNHAVLSFLDAQVVQ